MLPVAVEDDGIGWLTATQLALIGGIPQETLTSAAKRLGLVQGVAGVELRTSLALDQKSRLQIHYDDAACMRLGIDLRSEAIVGAILELRSLITGGSRVRKVATRSNFGLKALPYKARLLKP